MRRRRLRPADRDDGRHPWRACAGTARSGSAAQRRIRRGRVERRRGMTDSVHLFKVGLGLATPGGVLMPQLDEGPDAVPLQGPDETYGLPTTSLAGSLRAHVATRVPPHEVDRLFGRVE